MHSGPIHPRWLEHARRGALLALLLIFVPACHSRSLTADATDRPATSGSAAMSENLKNFELEVSSGGGFTGAWTGTRISADGTVTRWKTGPHGAGRKDESAGRLTPAQLEGLLEALESASFFGMTLDQPGNMTTQISATSGGRHKEVRFSGMSDSAPSALQGVLSRFDTAVGSLK